MSGYLFDKRRRKRNFLKYFYPFTLRAGEGVKVSA